MTEEPKPLSTLRPDAPAGLIYDADTNEVITVLWAQGESRADGPVRRATS